VILGRLVDQQPVEIAEMAGLRRLVDAGGEIEELVMRLPLVLGQHGVAERQPVVGEDEQAGSRAAAVAHAADPRRQAEHLGGAQAQPQRAVVADPAFPFAHRRFVRFPCGSHHVCASVSPSPVRGGGARLCLHAAGFARGLILASVCRPVQAIGFGRGARKSLI
jgi:hypothetical protein